MLAGYSYGMQRVDTYHALSRGLASKLADGAEE